MTADNAASGTAERATDLGPRVSAQGLRHVPLALFTIPMSFVGLGLALKRAGSSTVLVSPAPGLLVLVADLFLIMSAASLIGVLAAHAMKILRHRDQALADLTHPVRICFAAALPMTLVLLAIAVMPYSIPAAHVVWLAGTLLYGTVAIVAVGVWQRRAPVDLAMLNPIWFLPIVGHVLVAHCGARLGYVGTSWLVVGSSIPLWILVQTLLFYRNVFAAPLPPRLLPTLTVQVGPAPLIFIALCELLPGLDPLMRMIYFAGLGITLVLWVPRVPQFFTLGFAMPNWSFSFPLSALAASILLYAERTQSQAVWAAGLAVLAVPLVVTVALSILTVRAWRQGVFSRPEP